MIHRHEELVIAGAGPAGLAAAYHATKQDYQPLVLEASGLVGGISRTEEYEGYRFDIGGHRFYTKEKVINEVWHEVMGEDFIKVQRLSRIFYKGKFYQYPLEPVDALFKLGFIPSLKILASYVHCKARPIKNVTNLEQWVTNRFGKRLFETFFKTYTEKVWGIPCDEISADWAAQRIHGLSLKKAIVDSFRKTSNAKSLIREFEYPRLGPGMMWERFAEKVEEAGGEVLMESPTVSIRHKDKRVTEIELEDGTVIAPQNFISSIPLRTVLRQLDPPPPAPIMDAANRLEYRDFLVVALFVKRKEIFPDNWIYIHSEDVQVGRIQNFKNWSKEMVPSPEVSSLGMEYFCQKNDNLWDTKDGDLIELATLEAAKIGLVDARDVTGGCVIRQPKAYPVYNENYQENVAVIEEYLKEWENFQTIGRNGMHRYNNQDHSMLTGILAVENLDETAHNLWKVNTERSYQETFNVPKNSAETA